MGELCSSNQLLGVVVVSLCASTTHVEFDGELGDDDSTVEARISGNDIERPTCLRARSRSLRRAGDSLRDLVLTRLSSNRNTSLVTDGLETVCTIANENGLEESRRKIRSASAADDSTCSVFNALVVFRTNVAALRTSA